LVSVVLFLSSRDGQPVGSIVSGVSRVTLDLDDVDSVSQPVQLVESGLNDDVSEF
jgi:hypothetical protein